MKKGPFKMKGPGKKGNVGGVKISEKAKINRPKGFNFTGDKASTTPGYKSTKIAKAKSTKISKAKSTKISKAKSGGDLMTKAGKAKSFSTGSKKILSRAAKASRNLRGAGAGLILELGYRAYKSGQKKSGGKAVKGQKTNALNMRKSIFKK